MTEPPDDEDELRAFLESEYFGEMADDMLMDEIGRGDDHRTIYDELPEGEDELQDALHDIHEQPDDEPIPRLVSVEEAARILAEAKKKHDEQKAAEARVQSKGDNAMAISDNAQ